jgi:hypothetical protein
MTSKVFVSYALKDRKLAEAAKKELEKRGHVSDDTVFVDVQDVPVGEDIRQFLKSKIEASDALVVVLTDAAASSQWINYEVGLADALGKRIIVVTGKEPKDQRLLANLSSYQTLKLGDAG